MVARGRLADLRLLVPALVLVAALAGCDAAQKAQDVGRGVDKARQCAALVAELANIHIDLRPSSVARAASQADEAARKLDERARNIDQTDVRNAATRLADRLRQLAETARGSTPAQREQAVRGVTDAARQLASACSVPLDRIVVTT